MKALQDGRLRRWGSGGLGVVPALQERSNYHGNKSMENQTPICYNVLRKLLTRADIMGFKMGTWWHEAPDTEFDASGKQAIVKHLCYGPLETRIWYKLIDGQYCREIHFLEGLQAGERYTDFISKSEMLKVIENEIALCIKHNETDLATLFQIELENTMP